jgi:steroid delta-isomerase-like uncharacterized protein
MSVEANKTTIREWVEAGWNNGNFDLVDQKYAPNYTLHDPTAPNLAGREAFKQYVMSFRRAFPDFHMTLDDLVGEGDQVTWRWTVTGTHLAPLATLPATGKSTRVTGIVISRFVNGMWTEDYNQFDFYGMLQQLGIVPALA